MAGSTSGEWYADWQSGEHARLLDGRHALDDRSLVRNYESFNDVRLLNERLDRLRKVSLLEVGSATGEFYRYLRLKYPNVDYYGIDISRSAIARARQKYPPARFFLSDAGAKMTDVVRQLGMLRNPDIVYAKDVVHHQTNPFEFVTELLQVTAEALIMRLRTRDVGHTVTDPELSCQYHYQGWMPYIVMNLQELLEHITRQVPGSEVVVYRNHMILGGRENRFLPKECYLPETGTAETAVGIFLTTRYPRRVTVEDRPEAHAVCTFGYRLRTFGRRLYRTLAR